MDGARSLDPAGTWLEGTVDDMLDLDNLRQRLCRERGVCWLTRLIVLIGVLEWMLDLLLMELWTVG